MSRIGKKPIAIPSSVTVTIEGNTVVVKGQKGTLTRVLHPHVTVSRVNDTLVVGVHDTDNPEDRALWGLSQRLIANMIEGVTKGYTKKLELVGVGYRATAGAKTVTFSIGFSHPVEFPLPEGITVTVDKNTFLTVAGIDKELVGNVAARMRALRKPEPYKGKGIRYEGEVVRRKLGKAAKAAGEGAAAGG